MGKFSKKIIRNDIRNTANAVADKVGIDKKSVASQKRIVRSVIKYDKKAKRFIKRERENSRQTARGYAQYFVMWALKKHFKFSGKNLVTFQEKVDEIYQFGIDDKSVPTNIDVLVEIIHSKDEEAGGLCYPEYELRPFDEDGDLMFKLETNSQYERAVLYKMTRDMICDSNFSEIVFMVALYDKFGFRHRRLKRLIDTMRELYQDTAFRYDYKTNMAYIEKLCQKKFKGFDIVRKGEMIIVA